MLENQYLLFRDLDRRCVAGGLKQDECGHAVLLKRASIESDRIRGNKIGRQVLAGETTFVEVYDSFSHAFRGIRRFIPHRHNDAWNERLAQFCEIIPNVKHFTRRSVLALDNPVTCMAYGVIASMGIVLVWAHGNREEGVEGSLADLLFSDSVGGFVCLFAFTGFALGAFAMLKYRTRDPHMIHAREAAAYMDLNYAYYRNGDDRAWAQFIHSQGMVGRAAAPACNPD